MDLNNQKNSTYIVIGIGIVFILIIVLQYYSTDNPSLYARKLVQERALKDQSFRASAQSPLDPEEKRAFQGLSYYPVDESYRVPAELIKDAVKDTLYVSTSDGTLQQQVRIGQIEFTLHGREQKLIAYQHMNTRDRNTIFVPFRDLTSNVSTYGGGRYLDIPFKPDLEIDFNKAYHPYCVYNESYVCPIPPKANTISLEILAGEKNGDL